jgi:hypothetical protein
MTIFTGLKVAEDFWLSKIIVPTITVEAKKAVQRISFQNREVSFLKFLSPMEPKCLFSTFKTMPKTMKISRKYFSEDAA